MRVYIAGSRPRPVQELVRRFGDTAVDGEGAAVQAAPGESMVQRLAALSRCDAIWLPPDWRCDPRAVVEKAFADYQRIPRVEYCLPHMERMC